MMVHGNWDSAIHLDGRDDDGDYWGPLSIGGINSASATGTGVGAMGSSPIDNYWALADKADRKFARLRDVPLYGGSEWDSYFHKAFQVYTKLWKFQQENRERLVEAGLRRWEIGEIASRIGQLYYKYYQHTSDSTFLRESFIFYEALLTRDYFKDSGRDVSLVTKNLRFYARFIVLCLLLNRREMVYHLIRQFRACVEEYYRNFQGSDAKDWKRVMHEIHRFWKADAVCRNSRPLRYSIQLDPHPSSFCPVAKLGVGKPLMMKDAVLATYHHNEVKFAELSLDAFRFLQCLEWEPSGSFYRTKQITRNSNGSSGQNMLGRGSSSDDIVDQTLPPNPHKYILHRPSIQQLLLVLATACEGLPPDSILLVYLSASVDTSNDMRASPKNGISSDEGSEVHDSSPPSLDDPQNNAITQYSGSLGNSSGGLWFGSRGNEGLSHLYPSDILPFTRRPLFMVVDSNNSSAFEVICGQERGEPVALLLSPQLQPIEERRASSQDSSSSTHLGGGNFFTFFLTAPLLAFCRLVGLSISNLTQSAYEQAEEIVSCLCLEWGDMLSKLPTLDLVWARILLDPFLRQALLRFIFCRACLALHKRYGNKNGYLPRCLPLLPGELSPRGALVEASILHLATNLHVVDHFTFSERALASSSNIEAGGASRNDRLPHAT